MMPPTDKIPALHPVIQGDWPPPLLITAASLGRIFRNPLPALIYIMASVAISYAGLQFWDSEPPLDASFWTQAQANIPALILSMVTALALPLYGLALADRKQLSMTEFFKTPARRYGNTLGATLLLMVLGFVPLALLTLPVVKQQLGLLLVAWAVYALWLFSRYGLSVYAAAEKNIGPQRAFSYSSDLTRHNQPLIWGTIVVWFITAVVVMIPVALLDDLIPANFEIALEIVGALVELAFVASFAFLYRWLQANPTRRDGA